MNDYLQELMVEVSTLQDDITALHKQQPDKPSDQKAHSHDSDSNDATPHGSSHNGADDPEGERSNRQGRADGGQWSFISNV